MVVSSFPTISVCLARGLPVLGSTLKTRRISRGKMSGWVQREVCRGCSHHRRDLSSLFVGRRERC